MVLKFTTFIRTLSKRDVKIDSSNLFSIVGTHLKVMNFKITFRTQVENTNRKRVRWSNRRKTEMKKSR